MGVRGGQVESQFDVKGWMSKKQIHVTTVYCGTYVIGFALR
jgi:hypothetical protein